jgi:hypothetical protein
MSLKDRIQRQPMPLLRRVVRRQLPIQLLDQPADLGRSRIDTLDL